MNIVLGVILIFVISYLIYLLLAYLMLPKPFERVGKEDDIALSRPTQIITNEELKGPWTSSSGSSLIFNIKPTLKDRTAQSGNEYARVIQIGSKQTFQLLVAPDAGRGLNMAPARLEIFVKGYAKPEYAEIPNFPLQRWTAVVIVKNGRKFHIYLNGTLAVSHTCTAMPDFDDTQALIVGDKRLDGKVSLLSLAPYAMKAYEVRELVKNSVSTTGEPYVPFTLMSLFKPLMPSLPNIGPWCPGGNCTKPKSAGPMEEWSSPYA